MGLLDSGRFFEITRADLVVGYIGQTATNTRQRFTEAMGRVLFIDEAYSLAQVGGSHTDFGEEAINELVPLMENHRRGDRRDRRRLHRRDADGPGPQPRAEEPVRRHHRVPELQRRRADGDPPAVTGPPAPRGHARGPGGCGGALRRLPRDGDFANGREARRLLDAVVEAIANRVAESGDFSEESLSTVLEADVRVAMAEVSR